MTMANSPSHNATPAMNQSTTGMQNVHGDNPFSGGPSPTPNPASNGFTPQSRFPFLPPSSGYSQNPQIQTQGFHPSGLLFGLIPSMTGPNPNYAAGYNPTAMAGHPIATPTDVDAWIHSRSDYAAILPWMIHGQPMDLP
ncbi:hypothetical protein BT96DRAFT_1003814 [Gymnopus androsaceus JB14]|uniref:Uncharacterized protein n=1 Tax=Gymnopus androsaceus JB14 TaxID=1447944 RepID=A0A6A4GU25_9AGAR|nr:hypothetical protein BT96DRAFT_1003814 [Gymnopus androsaceus JB14]